MKIDKPLLQKLAHLARLDIALHDEATLLKDLNKILAWAEQLEEVDTTGICPLSTMSSAQNIFQDDTPQAPLAHERGLKNAPHKDSNYFRVPQIKD